jgi:hypothetical protein
LWVVLAVNAVMFAVSELASRLGPHHSQADALDIPGGAGNYAISLFVVGMALRSRLAVDVASGANLYGHNAC